MSDDTKNKNKGGKVVPFPIKKPEHISKIIEGVMKDIFDNLSDEQKIEFNSQMDNGAELSIKQSDENFNFNMKTVKLEDMSEIVDEINFDELNKMMDSVDDLKGRAFQYIKYLEWELFELAHALKHDELKEITEDLQKIFLKLNKKG